MREQTKPSGWNEWVSGNLPYLLSLAAMLGMGWASLKATDEKFATIIARLGTIEAHLAQQEAARACNTRNIDRLADRAGVTLPCGAPR